MFRLRCYYRRVVVGRYAHADADADANAMMEARDLGFKYQLRRLSTCPDSAVAMMEARDFRFE